MKSFLDAYKDCGIFLRAKSSEICMLALGGGARYTKRLGLFRSY